MNDLLLPPEPLRGAVERAVPALLGTLAGRGWMTRRAIRDHHPDWDERFIREVANASRGEVLSYPGSPGYILTREASADERDRAAAVLRSQAKQMDDRARSILRVHHGMPGKVGSEKEKVENA